MEPCRARMRRTFRILALAVAVALTAAVPASAAAAPGWVFKTLYRFGASGKTLDGRGIVSGLVRDAAGNLYGTTSGGGAHRQGTVFKLAPDGRETVLYSFCAVPRCADGTGPMGGVILDASGNLYGMAYTGAAHAAGAVFELTPAGVESVLYAFCSAAECTDGGYPEGGLVMDGTGNLYGTARSGGAGPPFNKGVVFRLSPGGIETVLYDFCSEPNCADGFAPSAGLVLDGAGNLYGTTLYSDAGGVVFKLASAGGATVLCDFGVSCAFGATPAAPVIIDGAGNIYGTTVEGGSHNEGTVFALAPEGGGTVLYDFCAKKSCADGAQPWAGLVRDGSGNLYGTTKAGGAKNGGTVFEVTASGEQSVLHSFCTASHCNDGKEPVSPLLMDAAGNLYGTTTYRGTKGRQPGTIFELVRQ